MLAILLILLLASLSAPIYTVFIVPWVVDTVVVILAVDHFASRYFPIPRTSDNPQSLVMIASGSAVMTFV